MKSFAIGLFCLFQVSKISAQEEDLLDSLNADSVQKEYVSNSFKSSRIIMTHSVQMLRPGVLDFRILHRFGKINGGLSEFFGLDGPANVRLGLDYALSNDFTIGIGRSTFNKELDGLLKYRLLQQSQGPGAVPLSLVLVGGTTIRTAKWTDGIDRPFADRVGYYVQTLIGKKFSEGFTFQLTPTFLHRNRVELAGDANNLFALGYGGRIKLSNRLSFNFDTYTVFNLIEGQGLRNPLSIGFDIETGGHVFQLHFTNAHGMNERAFLTETTNKWSRGDIEFGFNISRTFQLKKKRELAPTE